MKKTILAILAFCISASMAACTAEDFTAEITEIPAQTANTIAEVSSQDTVEINMDNWEEYFELRSVTEAYTGESGQVEGWDYLYGVFLKPEYVQRFAVGHVDFEISFDYVPYHCHWDSNGCSLGDKIERDLESDSGTATFGIEDFRNSPELEETSEFYGCIAGVVYGGSTAELEDGTHMVQVPENGEILHAEGILELS